MPVESDLLDYADLLVDFGDTDSLLGPGTVRDALRAMEALEGMEAWNDTDLVQIAAAASEGTEAAPRLELYPHDFDLERAPRITQVSATWAGRG
ncbi:hypothetical protein NGM33_06955 [Nocardiopsis dassonvillei]|uniref:hypothetical protein n=1 Tax=Nocardiopsis dassonvillei TaxID=2014 RepID=UPI0020A29773|nr:hypothetical protein [Nocardiopsis dassonvillei]MCP3013067.1 hypothetical protein [Nocardiopsis dassonvillei]